MANRQQWVVQHVTDDGTAYAREVGSSRTNPRTVTLPAEYVGEHAHLSYAATAYGVQGATVDSSHTMFSHAMSAAGVYVGMTRGRETNRLHVVAAEMADARVRFIEAMERDPADRGLEHATRAAKEVARDLVSDGPVRLVTDALARLDAQRAAHRAEDDGSATVLHAARDEADRVRAEVARPLAVEAQHDGAAYLATVQTEAAASARLATTGRFGKRKARAEHHAATEHAGAARASVRATWGELHGRRRQQPAEPRATGA